MRGERWVGIFVPEASQEEAKMRATVRDTVAVKEAICVCWPVISVAAVCVLSRTLRFALSAGLYNCKRNSQIILRDLSDLMTFNLFISDIRSLRFAPVDAGVRL